MNDYDAKSVGAEIAVTVVTLATAYATIQALKATGRKVKAWKTARSEKKEKS